MLHPEQLPVVSLHESRELLFNLIYLRLLVPLAGERAVIIIEYFLEPASEGIESNDAGFDQLSCIKV